jgi:hypothetical protein
MGHVPFLTQRTVFGGAMERSVPFKIRPLQDIFRRTPTQQKFRVYPLSFISLPRKSIGAVPTPRLRADIYPSFQEGCKRVSQWVDQVHGPSLRNSANLLRTFTYFLDQKPYLVLFLIDKIDGYGLLRKTWGELSTNICTNCPGCISGNTSLPAGATFIRWF